MTQVNDVPAVCPAGVDAGSAGTPGRRSVPGRRGVRLGRMSGVLRPRALAVPVLGLAVLFAVVAAAAAHGDYPIGVAEVVRVLFGGGDETTRFIVVELRLPRAATGALVGAALGLSGAITQAIGRNPLASPDILGVTAGASVAAVSVVVLGGTYGAVSGMLASVGVPVAALLGGLVTAMVVYLLAWRRGVDGYRLLLVGVGVTIIFTNVTMWLLTVGEVTDAGRALTWITGSLNGRGWEHVAPVGLALAVVVPLALLGGHVLGALQFDDDTARGLGVRLAAARGLLLLLAALLAAVATASAGPVAFVALAVPQIALRLVRSSRPPLVASAVLAAALTVAADLLARTAFSVALPVGIVTATLGAPYLMFLLVRRYQEVKA